MKKIYIVYSEKGNIGKSIEVFTKEASAARYARDKSGVRIIEKTLIKTENYE